MCPASAICARFTEGTCEPVSVGGAGRGQPRGMQSGMAEMQRKMAEMNGVQVHPGDEDEGRRRRRRRAGHAADDRREQAAKMQARHGPAAGRCKSQGGPAAAAAQQAHGPHGRSWRAARRRRASGSLMEMTMESSDFSTASIPDSVFAIPAGYQKVDAK